MVITNRKGEKFKIYFDVKHKYLLTKYSWSVNKDGTGRIVGLRAKVGDRHIYFHRLILKTKNIIDHIDRNPLNNKLSNLRVCSPTNNSQNLSIRINKITKFKGVIKSRNKWRARITVNKILIHLGYFNDEISAAKAYDRAALRYFKKFACTNRQLGLL